MALVDIKGISKKYADQYALNNLTLSLEEGEQYAILGASGSGKSTLLRCINRLHDPTAGVMKFNGSDAATISGKPLRSLRAQIGMIFQHFNLIPRKTVMTNVLTGTLSRTGIFKSILGIYTQEDRNKAQELIELVGLKGKENNRADNLSGGQQQRVACARALLGHPELIVADEPTSALDTSARESFLNLLFEQAKASNASLVLVSHDESLRSFFDRRVEIQKGELK